MKSLFGINISGGNCEICGSTLNALNSKKVGQEFVCKKCMGYVSNYFDIKSSTYDEIINHIKQRMNDKKEIESFFPSLSFGENNYLFVDEETGKFVISSKEDYKNDNADIFCLSDVISCTKRIEVKKEEVKYEDTNGNLKSFVPPYTAYKYDFFVDIQLHLKGYRKITIKLNKKVIDNNQETRIKMKSTGVLDILKDALVSRSFDGMNTNNIEAVMTSSEYVKFDVMAEQIVNSITIKRKREKIRICPYCDMGITDNENICKFCGANISAIK